MPRLAGGTGGAGDLLLPWVCTKCYIYFFKIKGFRGGVIITPGFCPRGRYVLVLFVNGPQPRGGFIIAPGFIIVLLGLYNNTITLACD